MSAAPPLNYLSRLRRARRGTTGARRSSLNQRIQRQAKLKKPAAAKPAPPVTTPADYFVPTIDIARRATIRGVEDSLGQGGLQGAPLGGSLGTNLRRATEDFTLEQQNIGRQYSDLATAQTDRARAAGVAQGGTLLEAAQRRRDNMGRDVGQLTTGYTRGAADIQTEAGRLRREGNIALSDLDLQQIDAAIGAGYVPPAGTPGAAPGAAAAPAAPATRFTAQDQTILRSLSPGDLAAWRRYRQRYPNRTLVGWTQRGRPRV